jgi:hypothetical protein
VGATDVVTVTAWNRSGAAVDLNPGTVRVRAGEVVRARRARIELELEASWRRVAEEYAAFASRDAGADPRSLRRAPRRRQGALAHLAR